MCVSLRRARRRVCLLRENLSERASESACVFVCLHAHPVKVCVLQSLRPPAAAHAEPPPNRPAAAASSCSCRPPQRSIGVKLSRTALLVCANERASRLNIEPALDAHLAIVPPRSRCAQTQNAPRFLLTHFPHSLSRRQACYSLYAHFSSQRSSQSKQRRKGAGVPARTQKHKKNDAEQADANAGGQQVRTRREDVLFDLIELPGIGVGRS